MDTLHVTQDDHGYWMLSLEKEDGTLALVAHQFQTADKAIEIANEMVREGQVTATIRIDPPRVRAEVRASSEYNKPLPRKAGE